MIVLAGVLMLVVLAFAVVVFVVTVIGFIRRLHEHRFTAALGHFLALVVASYVAAISEVGLQALITHLLR